MMIVLGVLALVVALFGLAAGSPAALASVLQCALCMGIGITCARYGSRIRAFVTSRAQEHLDDALDAQLAYWRIIGIVTLIGVLIFALACVVLLIVAAASL